MRINRRKLLSATGAFGFAWALANQKALLAMAPSVTPEMFDAWISLRGGESEAAYWYSEGLIRPIQTWGEVQSRMVGIETWVTPSSLRTRTTAVSLSRKLFFLLHLDKDEIWVNPQTGLPQRPSIFAYQVREFELVGGAIQYRVESHDLRGVRQGGTGVTFTVNKLGDQTHVNYASFPRRAGPDGQLQVRSGEVYDYFDNGPGIEKTNERFQMTWVGTNLEGNIANQRGWRFDTFDEIPNSWLKETIQSHAPMWTAPPKTLAEIETLRAQIPIPLPDFG